MPNKHDYAIEINKENENTDTTTRKQIYTYDFHPQVYSSSENQRTETSSESHKHSSEPSISLSNQTVVEEAILRSASEQPAPVTEDLSDDTPMPTENYFKKSPTAVEQRTEINIMDGTVTPSSINITSPTIYSTTAPIKLEYEDSSKPPVRLAPYSTSENPMYSVTENILEQSPFLPENENGDSILNILHASHDDIEESNAKAMDIEDESSSENENSNLISGSEIIPQKAYKIEGSPSDSQNSTTIPKEVEPSEEKTDTPSDSTEIYSLQESRTHNHDKIGAAKTIKNQSDETMEFSHNTEGGVVPTTIIPFAKNSNEDSTEMEQMTISDLPSMLHEEKSHPNESPSSSVLPSSSSTTTEENREKLDEISMVEGRNINKNIEAIFSDFKTSSTEQMEQLFSSTSEKVTTLGEKVVEISSLAEPSATDNHDMETTILPSEQSSTPPTKVDSTIISMEQTTLDMTKNIETDVKFEEISSTNESDEVSPPPEPSLSSGDMDSSTWVLKPESSKAKTKVEKIETTSTTVISPSSTESQTHIRPTSDELKVIPLQTTVKPDDDEKINEEEVTESTTGHFLSKATFQLINQSVETSVKSFENGNDSTSTEKDNEQKAILNVNSTNESYEYPTSKTKFGYSRCTAGQFECLNGTSVTDGGACISLSQRCDAIPHCSDLSDEAECEVLGCPGHFQCNDGSCLARSLVCDKILHCHDGSDEFETLCNDWKCKFDEIACSENGQCLPAILQCDGISHCSNQADETNCSDRCKNNEFYCSSQRKCIPETFLCDGQIDCLGNNEIFKINSRYSLKSN